MEMSVPCITNRRKLPVALFSSPGALFLAGDPKAGGDALLALLRRYRHRAISLLLSECIYTNWGISTPRFGH